MPVSIPVSVPLRHRNSSLIVMHWNRELNGSTSSIIGVIVFNCSEHRKNGFGVLWLQREKCGSQQISLNNYPSDLDWMTQFHTPDGGRFDKRNCVTRCYDSVYLIYWATFAFPGDDDENDTKLHNQIAQLQMEFSHQIWRHRNVSCKFDANCFQPPNAVESKANSNRIHYQFRLTSCVLFCAFQTAT